MLIPRLSQQTLAKAGIGAFFRPRDLRPIGVSFRELQRLVAAGKVEKVGFGHYRLASIEPTENETVAMVAAAIPAGVVCLLTALRIHEIGTQVPNEIWIAIPHGSRKPARPPARVRIFRFSGAMMTYGVTTVHMLGVPVKITSPARTIVDCFRLRSRVGLDVAMEALRDRDSPAAGYRRPGLANRGGLQNQLGDRALHGRPVVDMSPRSEDSAESIRHRLRNTVRARGDDVQFALQRFASERFLFRLGRSRHRERFILKGATLFALWGVSMYRPTRDLDFTGYGNPSAADVLGPFGRCARSLARRMASTSMPRA